MHMDVVTKMCRKTKCPHAKKKKEPRSRPTFYKKLTQWVILVRLWNGRFKPCDSTNENTFMRDQILRLKRPSGTQKWETFLLQRVRRMVSLYPHHPFPKHITALREHPRPASSLVGERKGEVIIHLPLLLGSIVDRPPSDALHPEHRGNKHG